MTNIELLGFMRTVDFLENYVIESRRQVMELPYGAERERLEQMAKDASITKAQRMQGIQNECTHPIGVKVGGSVYCPICEQELIPGSVITIEKEAGGHNMGFIREKLAEILPLIPEVTPAQMVEYVDEELKTFSRQ